MWILLFMAKDRSPKSPRNTLKATVDAVAKLFAGAKRAPISRDQAARTMGYTGITGVSATMLGSLGGYGLIQKRGADISVSDLAISILHPTGQDQRKSSIREAALTPPLFRELAEHYLEVDANVLTSKLVQMGFSPDAAKITAKVFLANAAYAELSENLNSDLEQNDDLDDFGGEGEIEMPQPIPVQNSRPAPPLLTPAAKSKNVLATYKIPLGANEAELVFTGERLDPEDFDALIDYVEIFKKQFARKQKQEKTESPDADESNPAFE